MKPVLLALAVLAAPLASATEVRIGPIVGGSLLERTDTSLTHGPLTDEVTLGRSVLGGGVLDLSFGRDGLAFELTAGPYHGDVERSCVKVDFSTDVPCRPEPLFATSRVLAYGMHYRHAFGGSGWMPVAGVGIGAKHYTFEDHTRSSPASTTFAASLGVERSGRLPLRLEARGVLVPDHPLLLDRHQLELQVRASVLFRLR